MALHGGGTRSRGRTINDRSMRGRGRGGGRGGGRGRGASNNAREKPAFSSSRTADNADDSDIDAEQVSNTTEEDEASDQNIESSDDDVVDTTAHARPYTTLLQRLSADTGPRVKRQKVEGNTDSLKASASSNEAEKHGADIDEVEEAEEGPETDATVEEDVEDIEDASDPFETHFANPSKDNLSEKLEAIQRNQWSTQKIELGRYDKTFISVPGEENWSENYLPKPVDNPGQLKLKKRLVENFMIQRPTFDELEKLMAPIIFNYHDILYCERTPENSQSLRRLACLHAINHVFKTRDRVIRNNAKLAREDDADLELRDQGFTRPKILMLLPTRESCVRMVNTITMLCNPEQQENRKRFEESYVEKEDSFSSDKTEDFRELFSGNDDDMFRLGMKFTRKTVKLFSQFYNSDIIFASPLGLRMALGSEDDKKVDHDFLSSIEIVIIDQANALLMQNWEHVEFIFDHLNLQPKASHGCDFGRLREWYLDNNSRYFRQTIALSAFNSPELNTLFYNQSRNWAGRWKICASYPGSIQELGLKIKQTFSRFDSPSPVSDPDARFSYFTTAVIPRLTRHSKDSSSTLIFIPSYLDFVRVRNYFSTSKSTNAISFASISEYTSVRDVARARSHFFSGRHHILLYTERAHHFRRYQIRGVKKVIMYGLPDNPIFYKEIVGGYLGRSLREGQLESSEGTVRVMFSKWDVLKLERIAGTERVGKMIRDKGDTFDFV